ncbi:MAG: lysostaphin resistance A-like protein [Candidatus Acidiferrales bacterium]
MQLLFPLGSFLLLVGSTHNWVPPGHTYFNPLVAPRSTDLWFDISRLALLFRMDLCLIVAEFTFFVSLLLWCVRVSNPIRQFRRWVFMPIAAAAGYFLVLVFLARGVPSSVIESHLQMFQESLRLFPARLLTLGAGFYVAIVGVGLLAFALHKVALGKIGLPLTFRQKNNADRESGANDFVTLKLFKFIFSLFAISVVINLLSMIGYAHLSFSWVLRLGEWPRNFPVWEWLESFLMASAAAAVAVALLGKSRKKMFAPLRLLLPWRDFILPVLIPVVAAEIPRIIVSIYSGSSPSMIVQGAGFSMSFEDMAWPDPLPALLIVYVIALLEEIALRGFLQSALMKIVGLRRAIFLTGILWALLPLGYGIYPPNYRHWFLPGLDTLELILIYLAFSVPIGWVYARTQSILAVAVMHGTLLLFLRGNSEIVFHEHPSIYWVSFAIWILSGWYLFHKYPIPETGTQPAHLTPQETV